MSTQPPSISPDELKRAAAIRALDFVAPGHAARPRHRLDGAPLRRAAGRAGARRARRRRRADLGGDPRRCRKVRRAAHDARRDPRARPHGRRRRRDRPRPRRHQGRRRRAAAREDRGVGVAADDRHRRLFEGGADARALSAAGGGGAVRPCGDLPHHRGGDPRGRLCRARWCCGATRRAILSSPMAGTSSSTRRSARSPIRLAWHRTSPPSPAWSSTGSSSAWCGSRSSPGSRACASSRL